MLSELYREANHMCWGLKPRCFLPETHKVFINDINDRRTFGLASCQTGHTCPKKRMGSVPCKQCSTHHSPSVSGESLLMKNGCQVDTHSVLMRCTMTPPGLCVFAGRPQATFLFDPLKLNYKAVLILQIAALLKNISPALIVTVKVVVFVCVGFWDACDFFVNEVRLARIVSISAATTFKSSPPLWEGPFLCFFWAKAATKKMLKSINLKEQ